MPALSITHANLSDTQLDKIQTLEADLGHCVIALQNHPCHMATLTQNQTDQLKSLETELDLVLVACSE